MKPYLSLDMEGATDLPDFTFIGASINNCEHVRVRKIMTYDTKYA